MNQALCLARPSFADSHRVDLHNMGEMNQVRACVEILGRSADSFCGLGQDHHGMMLNEFIYYFLRTFHCYSSQI